MSEHDEVLYCYNCGTRQMFNLGGTGRNAVCFMCGLVISGLSNIRRARKKARLHYATETFNKRIVESFDDMDKLLRGRYAK